MTGTDRKVMASEDSGTSEEGAPRRRPQQRSDGGQRPRRLKAAVVVRRASEQLHEVSGLQPEGVSAFKRSGDGWEVELEVVEIRRVPDTASVVATYSVRLDSDGDLVGYERTRRYSRGQLDR